MNSISWKIFRQLLDVRNPQECDRIPLSHLLQNAPSQAEDDDPIRREKSQLTDDLSALKQEVDELRDELAICDNSESKGRLLSLARHSRELSRSISLLRTLTIPEQIRVLELQRQEYENSRQATIRQCRELQRRIETTRSTIQRKHGSTETPLTRELESLKGNVLKAVECHKSLKKMIRGESDLSVNLGANVDSTTVVLQLLEKVRVMKLRREEKAKELENMIRIHERKIETLRVVVRQRDFYMHQEPIVFRRPPKADLKTATELFERRQLDKPAPRRFVRATSPGLLEPKKVPPPPPLEPMSKFYHPVPEYMAKSVLEKSVKPGKVKPIRTEPEKKSKSRIEPG
jgi:hypothetical protein